MSISSRVTPSFCIFDIRGEGSSCSEFNPTSNSIVASSVLMRYETPVSTFRSLLSVCQSISGSISSLLVAPMFSILSIFDYCLNIIYGFRDKAV